MQLSNISIVIPAKNEAESFRNLMPRIAQILEGAEVIIVDDGSSDDTVTLAREQGFQVVSHPYSIGNGAAVKSGLRAASREIVVCMDGDGQHQPEDVPRLLSALEGGADMAVGARTSGGQASLWRGLANRIYNRFAGWVVGHRIPDLTSGMRAARRQITLDFLHLLPNGFSYPTTLTMAFFRAGYPVAYVPIEVHRRTGKSHISPVRDGIRFLLIIFKVGTLYSPLKIFFPLSVALFASGLGWYLHTYMAVGRFTNMSAILILSALIVFLMGLISEQITGLLYSRVER